MGPSIDSYCSRASPPVKKEIVRFNESDYNGQSYFGRKIAKSTPLWCSILQGEAVALTPVGEKIFLNVYCHHNYYISRLIIKRQNR